MQTIQNNYRGFNLVMQLGFDRIFVVLLIALSLMAATSIGFELAVQKVPVLPEIF